MIGKPDGDAAPGQPGDPTVVCAGGERHRQLLGGRIAPLLSVTVLEASAWAELQRLTAERHRA